MRKYSVSNSRITGTITVDYRGIVASSSPVFQVFIGQHSNRLMLWMQKMDKTTVNEVKNTQMEFAWR